MNFEGLNPGVKILSVLLLNLILPGLGNIIVIGRSLGNIILLVFCIWAWFGHSTAVLAAWGVLMFIKAFTDIYKPDNKFEATLEESYPLKRPALRRDKNGQSTGSAETPAAGTYASMNFTKKLKELEHKDFDAELKAYKKKKELSDAELDFDDQTLFPALPDNLAPGQSITTNVIEYESVEISEAETPTQRPLQAISWSANHPVHGDSQHELVNPQDPGLADSYRKSLEAQDPTHVNSHHHLVNPQDPADSYRESMKAQGPGPGDSHHALVNPQLSSTAAPPPLPQQESEAVNDELAPCYDLYSEQNLNFNADVASVLSSESHFRHLGISQRPAPTKLDSTSSTADSLNLLASVSSATSESVLGQEFFGSHSPHHISKLDSSAEDIFASFGVPIGVPIGETVSKTEQCLGCGTPREGKNPICHSCGAHFREEI